MTKKAQNSEDQNNPGIMRRSGRRAASFLGFTDIKRGLETQIANISESGERTKRLFEGYRAKLHPKQPARVETFEEAVQRLRLTKQDLKRRRKELSFASYCYMTLLAITTFFFVLGLANERWMAALSTFTFLLTEGALIFQARFRIWQIDARRLGSPQQFIQDMLNPS